MNKKTAVFDVHGKKAKEIELPEFFQKAVRDDIISRAIETKKTRQPYSPSPVAGKQHAASGKVVHRRHVWRSGYGRGMSRIPRKIISRKGSQFNWIGAEVASTRGGRRAHPPKIISMITRGKMNKKEARAALISALSATADKKQIASKYQRIKEKDLKELPIIIEPAVTKLGTKELFESMKKILGDVLLEVSLSKKTVRSGRGKRRGRKYKSEEGALIVLGKNEKMMASIFSSRNSENLGISDLAAGGPGRIVIYTEQAIKDLEERLEKNGRGN